VYFRRPQQKPRRWGSFADVQYAIRKNMEKIYGCNPDNNVLVMPLFWGLPCLDYSGKANHGTNYGATYKDGSLDFDGGNDYVDVDESIRNENNYTVSLWFRTESTSGIDFYSEGSISTNTPLFNFVINTSGDGIVGFNHRDDDADIVTGNGTSDVNDNNWHYVTVVRANDNWELFVDVNSEDTATKAGIGTTTTTNAAIGVLVRSTYTAYFDGLIDEVRISNTALTSDQIALFHDRPWDLYRPVSRPIWSIPAGGGVVSPTGVFYGPLYGPLGGPI